MDYAPIESLSQSIPKDLLSNLMNSCQRVRVFDPLKVLQIFLFQVMNQFSCRSALSVFSLRGSVSLNSGAYTRAKKRLPEKLLKSIALRTAEQVEAISWNGRVVKFIDGTTMQMEDTVANQKEYPQNPRQKAGLGQPILRALFVFSLSTDRICDIEIAPYTGKGTAEPSLLRRILHKFNKGEVLVMDRFYTGMIQELESKELDYLIRARDNSSKKLFKGNKRIIKRSNNSRLIKYISKKNGYRDKIFYFITNLPENINVDDIANLYAKRWKIELGLRDIKRTMGSFFLRSKTPEMIRKELYVFVIGHNLIRHLMALVPRDGKKSFKIAKQLYKEICTTELKTVALDKVIKVLSLINWKSSFRVEPRVIKKRNKGSFGYMMKPRDVLRAEILAC